MKWWANQGSREAVIAKCMDPAAPRESAGVAAMALHGAGRARLLALADTAAPDVSDIVPALATLDTGQLLESFAKAVGPSEAAQMLEWHWQAAQGARSVAAALVSKQMSTTVAIQRAAAAYGIPPKASAQYVATVAAPLPPAAVDDEGLRAVQVWADEVSRSVHEAVSKEIIWYQDGRRVDVERDGDGRFAQKQAQNTNQQEQQRVDQQEIARRVAQRRQQMMQSNAQRSQNLVAQARRRREQQQQKAKAQLAERLLEQPKQQKAQEAKQDEKQSTQQAENKKLLEAARQWQQQLAAQTREKAKKVNHYLQVRSLLIDDLPPDEDDWDPPVANNSQVRNYYETNNGTFGQVIWSSEGAANDVGRRIWIQVPVDILIRAASKTYMTPPESPSDPASIRSPLHARMGPRLSVETANHVLTREGRSRIGVATLESGYGDAADSVMKKTPTIDKNSRGEWVVQIPVMGAVLSDTGELSDLTSFSSEGMAEAMTVALSMRKLAQNYDYAKYSTMDDPTQVKSFMDELMSQGQFDLGSNDRVAAAAAKVFNSKRQSYLSTIRATIDSARDSDTLDGMTPQMIRDEERKFTEIAEKVPTMLEKALEPLIGGESWYSRYRQFYLESELEEIAAEEMFQAGFRRLFAMAMAKDEITHYKMLDDFDHTTLIAPVMLMTDQAPSDPVVESFAEVMQGEDQQTQFSPENDADLEGTYEAAAEYGMIDPFMGGRKLTV